MDFDKIDEELTFNFGTKEYDGVIIKREYIKSGGFLTTDSHKQLYKLLKSGADQIKVAYNNFCLKDSEPHSSIVLFHGIAEHSQRYNAVCFKFAKDGYDVHSVDYRPFGRSGGPKGAICYLGEYHEDMIACLKRTKINLPLFIFAHSMGCGSLITFLMNNPTLELAGVILSSPFVKVDCEKQNLRPIDQMMIRRLRYTIGHLYNT